MVDVLVLGSGSAGYYTAFMCLNGLHVTLVEKEALGGTGFGYGALPVKILLDSIKKIQIYLFSSSGRLWHKTGSCSKQVESDLKGAGVKIVYGEGQFVERDAVKVQDNIIKAKT